MGTELREKIRLGHFVGRKVTEIICRAVIPTRLKAETPESIDGIEKAKAILRSGKGLVIIYTHPSRTDTHRLTCLWQEREFAERRCLIPIAYHQFTRLARASAWPSGIDFYPIVTKETVDRRENDRHEEGFGTLSFLDAAVKALPQGGTVLLAPSMTRTSRLSLPERLRPTDTLLNYVHRKKVLFGIFVTGFEINGTTSYESAMGFNLFKRYILHTGRTLEDHELSEQLARFRQQRGLAEDPRRPFNETDQWLYETQLPLFVPPAYLPH